MKDLSGVGRIFSIIGLRINSKESIAIDPRSLEVFSISCELVASTAERLGEGVSMSESESSEGERR